MYPLFESIRIDGGKAPLLEWHQKRLMHSYQTAFGKECPWQLKRIQPTSASTGRTKWRFLYNEQAYQNEIIPYRTSSLRRLKCVEIQEYQYPHKWTDRAFIETAYQNKGSADDVLFLQNGWLRDTSYCNIALFSGHQWITPKPPLFPGVERERQIQKGNFVPRQIHWRELPNFESFVLINALRPFEEQHPQKIVGNIIRD